ncbi:hypothetical protein CH252_04300 [Rhodococcus sp. 06-1477-1B]|nr:hypothetical protein CH252_04300 [Rhodococcus sp. 06-1477-1B]
MLTCVIALVRGRERKRFVMTTTENAGSFLTRGDDARAPAAGRGEGRVSRRALVAGAAWSVPAVMLTSVSPAWAVSGNTLSVSAPNGQVLASGAVPVTATVTDPSGQPVAGAAVSFSGPTGASFTPVSTTTDTTGSAVTQLDLDAPWAKPGSSVTVTAVSGSDARSASFTLVGSNLAVAGADYSFSLAQSELVFPSPVVDALTSGFAYTWHMVLLANGTVWTMGENNGGQLGDGSTTSRTTWAQVAGVSGAIGIAAVEFSGFALLSDGSVKAWGANNRGQLGNGSYTPSLTPVAVVGLSGVTQIAGGAYAAYALMPDGTVTAWGSNASGQLGDGTKVDRRLPSSIPGLSGVTRMASTYSTAYALSSNGSVKAWGRNGYGEVGIGSTTDQLTPTVVSGLSSGVTQIAGGFGTGYAVLSDGSVKAWGYNNYGQVGIGSTTNQLTPTVVSGLSNVTQIAGGALTGYALSSDGSVDAWGYNGYGQIGDGTTTNRPVPVAVSVPDGRPVRRLATSGPGSLTAMVVMGDTGSV